MKMTVKEFLALISRKEVRDTDLLVNDTANWYAQKKAVVIGDNKEDVTFSLDDTITVSGSLITDVSISLWSKLLKKDGGKDGRSKV
jgi:hypothetical protein